MQDKYSNKKGYVIMGAGGAGGAYQDPGYTGGGVFRDLSGRKYVGTISDLRISKDYFSSLNPAMGMDNPLAPNHDQYQRAVDRILFAVLLLTALIIDFKVTVATAVVMAAAVVILWFVYHIVDGVVFKGGKALFRWLCGHQSP